MDDFSVLKVYETAAVIGREIETVIDECGSEAVANLMPHVIKVLEQLELLVNQKEHDKARIESLEEQLVLVRNDGDRKNDDVNKLQLEIGQLEELIKCEEIDLMNVADKIHRENRHLKEQLTEKDKMVATEFVQEQETIKVLNQMKETVDKQRDELRRKDADVRSKVEEIEALQQQVDRYLKINLDLHRKNKLQQEYAKNLIHEKSQLHSQIAGMEQDHQAMMASNVQVHDEVQTQSDGGRLNGEGQEKTAASGQSTDAGTDVDQNNSNMQWVNVEGKMIIDKKDPNRPRFTLKEMSFVLEERDTVKMRITELEDELEELTGPKVKSPVLGTPDHKLQVYSRRERLDSGPGIKRFFSDILKKFSPQKKPSDKEAVPGYIDGAWCVLDPDDLDSNESNRAKTTQHGNTAKTNHHGNTSRELAYTSSNGIGESNGEAVHLDPYPDGDKVPLLTDSDLNKNVNPQHFAPEKDVLTLHDNSSDKMESDKTLVESAEQTKTDSSNPTDQHENSVDVNSNNDRSHGALGDEGRPSGGSKNEEQGQ